MTNLDGIIPKVITENIIVGYSEMEDYEKSYFKLMEHLEQEEDGDASDFLKDDFVDRLERYFPENIQLSSSDPIRKSFKSLFVKWFIQKRKEYSEDDERFNELFETVQVFEKDIVRSDPSFYDNNFTINSSHIENELGLECIYKWDSLLPKLKSIYEDFYQKGHDCKTIVQKYFNGNLNNDPLLQFAIGIVDEIGLGMCIYKGNSYKKSSKIYSDKELNEMMSSNLFIKISWYALENDNDLIMTVKTGNKIKLFDTNGLESLLERYKRLGLWSEKYMPSSLLFGGKAISLESISYRLRGVYYDKSIIGNLEKLNIKE